MKPQEILVDFVQCRIDLFKQMDHSDKGVKISKIPGFVIFWEESAVSKAVVEDGFVRVRGPVTEIGQPKALFTAPIGSVSIEAGLRVR